MTKSKHFAASHLHSPNVDSMRQSVLNSRRLMDFLAQRDSVPRVLAVSSKSTHDIQSFVPMNQTGKVQDLAQQRTYTDLWRE